MTRTRRLFPAPAVWLLVLAALSLRALAPAGWMPVAAPDGFRVAICTGGGPLELTLELDGRLHKQAPAPAKAHDPCPFGLLTGQAADLPDTSAFEPVRLASEAAPGLAFATNIVTLPRAVRPPSRGPPVPA